MEHVEPIHEGEGVTGVGFAHGTRRFETAEGRGIVETKSVHHVAEDEGGGTRDAALAMDEDLAVGEVDGVVDKRDGRVKEAADVLRGTIEQLDRLVAKLKWKRVWDGGRGAVEDVCDALLLEELIVGGDNLVAHKDRGQDL